MNNLSAQPTVDAASDTSPPPAKDPRRELPGGTLIVHVAFGKLTDSCDVGVLGPVNAMLDAAEAFLAMDPGDRGFLAGGKNPVASLISLPRAGKSRALDEMFARPGKPHAYPPLKQIIVIRITFNHFSTLRGRPRVDAGVGDRASWANEEFWLRVGHAVHATKVARDDFADYRDEQPTRTWGEVRALLRQYFTIDSETRVVILADEFTKLLDRAVEDMPEGDAKIKSVYERIGTEVCAPAESGHRMLLSGFETTTVNSMVTQSGRRVKHFHIPSGWGTGVVEDFAPHLFKALRAQDPPLPEALTSALPSKFIVAAGHSAGILGSALTELANSTTGVPSTAADLFSMRNFVPTMMTTYSESKHHADLIDQYFEAVFADRTARLKESAGRCGLIHRLQAECLAYPTDTGFVLSSLALQTLCRAADTWASSRSSSAAQGRVLKLREVLVHILDVVEGWAPVRQLDDGSVTYNGTNSINRDRGERFEDIVALALELRRLYCEDSEDFLGVPVNVGRDKWHATFHGHWPITEVVDGTVFVPEDAHEVLEELGQHMFVKPTDPSHVAADFVSTHGFIQVKWSSVTSRDVVAGVKRLVEATNVIAGAGVALPDQTYCLIARDASKTLEQQLKTTYAALVERQPSTVKFTFTVVAGAEMERLLTTSIRDLVREHQRDPPPG